MKAMILNSGSGSRLGVLTENMPKALLEVAGKPLLGYQLDNLTACGVSSFIITTGPFEEKIRDYVAKNYASLHITYVNNPEYQSTNYIYSMFLAKKEVDDHIVLLHGDLFFQKVLLQKLLGNKHSNCVLVNRKVRPPEKDFKAVLARGRVVKIGVQFFGKNSFFCAPLYKFAKADFLFWLDEIEKHVAKGNLKIYAENVFNEVSNKILLYPLYYNGEVCLEIDTKEDLDRAKDLASSILAST